MTDALLGLVTGIAAGTVMTRGGLCFNRGLRRAAFERRSTVLRAFGIAVAAQLVLLPALVALDVDPLVRAAGAGGPTLLPAAQVVGGLVFGAGMALAGGCVTGMLWKAGAGSVALALAVAGFAAGELLVRGPASGVIGTLDDASRPAQSGLPQLVAVDYEPLAVAIGLAALALLLASRRDGAVAGLALAAVAAAAWVTADLAGYGYGLGFVGAADETRRAIEAGGRLPFQLWLALGVVVGAALVAGRQLRVPDAPRATRAVAGGLLMGMGGSIAHGCNIGHGLTGLPLLSLGSALATASIAAGALVTWRALLATRPALRGTERMVRA
jgi:uncharacterized protein